MAMWGESPPFLPARFSHAGRGAGHGGMNHHHHHHLLHPREESTNLSGARAPGVEEGPEERGPQDVYRRRGGIVSKEMIKNIHPISGQHRAGIWEVLLAKGSCAGAAPSTVLSVPATFLPPPQGQESLERQDRRTGTVGDTGCGGEGQGMTLPSLSPCAWAKELGSSPFPTASIFTWFFLKHSETMGLRRG